MKVLCVRQPWAWAIIHRGKDIENRTQRTHYRGTLLIAASKNASRKYYEETLDFFRELRVKVPPLKELTFGAILGKVDLVDCVDSHRSRWFQGDWGYVLRDPVALDQPIPIKGRLGLFDPPPGVVRKLGFRLGRR